MSVVVDLRPLANSHSGRGIGRYVRGLWATPPAADGLLEWREQRRWSWPAVRHDRYGTTVVMPPRPRMRLDPLGAAWGRRDVERRSPSLVHLNDPYTVHLAPRCGRVVVTLYDLLLLEATGRLPDLFRRGVAAARRREGTRWVAISGTVADEAMRRLSLRARDVDVVSPGPTTWPPHTAVPWAGALVVGALDEHKRPDHAVEAARQAGVPLLFAGRHEPSLVTRWGLQPHQLLPDPDDAQLAGRLAGVTAVIHASRAEGFGLVVLEALTLGTPVVAYDLPVTREIVGPDYPLVPERFGPAGLARSLSAMNDGAARAAALAAAAPHVAARSWSSGREQLLELYRALA